MKIFKIALLISLFCSPVNAEVVKLSKSVDEGSHSWIGGTFYDKDGNKTTPDSISFWVTDVRTGEILVPERTPPRMATGTPTPTAIGASPTPTFKYPSTVVFELPVCASRMLTTNQATEDKRITVKFIYSGTKLKTSEAEWKVNQTSGLIVNPPSTPGNECTPAIAPTPTPTNTPVE